MKLQTPVIDERCKVCISYKEKILLIGSCFSDNIGQILCDYGFDAMVNPFGTLYNPASIASSIKRLIDGTPFTKEECVQMGAGSDLVCSFSHHTSFARQSCEEFLENANARLKEACRFFKECDKVIITFGTSWIFIHDNAVVSNCLKRDAKEFERKRLEPEESEALLKEVMQMCHGESACSLGIKPKQFIFTVSPIRHFKDGAHGNQISKASLLLAVEKLTEDRLGQMPQADYFPAYEIFMDELRDYRFYAEDMCHPTAQATQYIAERFLDWALVPHDRIVLEESIRKFKRSRHIIIRKA